MGRPFEPGDQVIVNTKDANDFHSEPGEVVEYIGNSSQSVYLHNQGLEVPFDDNELRSE